MKNKNVRLKEIALDLNVSINTVSRALRDCSDVSRETKEKVMRKAIEYGYMPNIIAQSLKNDDKKCIAIILSNFRNLLFNVLSEICGNLLIKAGYDFTIIYTTKHKVDVDCVKRCISQRVDGIISFIDLDKESVEYIKYNNIVLIFSGIPKINQTFSIVHTDDESGGYLAANYLLNYHNLENFIYIGYKGNKNSNIRFESFKNMILKRKPKAKINYLEYDSNSFFDKVDILDYIEDDRLGMFMFNDETVYDFLEKVNVKYPNFRKMFPGVHIVGFDCLSTRIKGLIDITSIDYDYEAYSKAVLEIFEKSFKDKNYITAIPIKTTLHQRIYK